MNAKRKPSAAVLLGLVFVPVLIFAGCGGSSTTTPPTTGTGTNGGTGTTAAAATAAADPVRLAPAN
jgi:hypothetical protein